MRVTFPLVLPAKRKFRIVGHLRPRIPDERPDPEPFPTGASGIDPENTSSIDFVLKRSYPMEVKG